MRLGHNSTIIRKEKICKSCGKLSYHFSKGRCQPCSTREDTLKKMEQETEKMIFEEDLSGLIEDADRVISQYVRLSAADKTGHISCFICGDRVHWKEAQNMHYIKRGQSLYLRHDLRNNKAGCKNCNEFLGGNYKEYAKKLEESCPGITDLLYTEGNTPYKVSREELKTIIAQYSPKIIELKKWLKD